MVFQLGPIDGAHVWSNPRFKDERGSLTKSYVGGVKGSFPVDFQVVEHFFTVSKKNVFRGMHFQGYPHGVSKIVSIVQGSAQDYLLDLRVESKTFGNLTIQNLESSEPVSMYIPVGVAHGYISLENETIMSYKLDGLFCPNCDNGVSGATINSFLPVSFESTIRSEKDLNLVDFENLSYTTSCEI